MVASAQLLQTNIALSPRAHPRLHGLHHQHCHPIKRLLSLSFLHFVINVDFCLTCTLNIPAIIPHLCLSHRRTSKCTHWSSAFLLFHAHPLTHLPQLQDGLLLFQGSQDFGSDCLLQSALVIGKNPAWAHSRNDSPLLARP